MSTVVVTSRLPARVEEALRARYDARLNTADRPLDETALAEAAREADVLLPMVADRVTARVIAAAPRLRLIANFGVGYNHIDVAAARARGIVVTNTPGVLTEDTADLTIALMLMVARRAGEGERLLRAGAWTGWRPTHLLGTRLAGSTLGVIGLGRIGQAVARRATAGLGMRVLYHNPSSRADAAARSLGAERCETVDELLARSDVVSLHCPATPATHHLIDAARLAAMREGAILVNTARGDVVDEQALVDALRDGRLRGAGLDVYEYEPRVHPALLSMENVVLLPHLGSATEETRTAMGERALTNIEAFLAGREPPDRVA